MPRCSSPAATRRLGPLLLVLVGGLVCPRPAQAQSITLDAPAEIGAGAEVTVSWSGTAGKGDFISLDPAGAPEREYSVGYVYAAKGSPATLRASGTPGDYAVRYHSGASGYPVLASARLRVVPVSATVEVPAAVEMGAAVAIAWSGPDNERDFISIDAEGAAPQKYGAYAYTSKGSPVEIAAPAQPGRYDVRYHLGASGYAVIGSAPLVVTTASATVEVPARAGAGSAISVHWTGPDNERDFISVDPTGAAESAYGRYAYTSVGSPLEIVVPDEPGTYRVRYHLGGSGYPVIGSASIEVGDVSATLEASTPIVAGEAFESAGAAPTTRRTSSPSSPWARRKSSTVTTPTPGGEIRSV